MSPAIGSFVAIYRTPSMVERNILVSNLLIFLAATTGVIIGPLSRVQNAAEGDSYDQMRKKGENNIRCAGKIEIRPRKIMLHPCS